MNDDGLTAALRVEFEAVYAYSAAVAHLSGALRDVAAAAEQEHRDLRDAAIVALADTGRAIPQAAPAYQLAADPEDNETAVVAISAVEERAASAWRAALATEDRGDRRIAVDSLSTVAQIGAAWRRGLGETPSVPAFPGRP